MKSDDQGQSFCQIILQNLKKISTEVCKLKPFEIAMLVKFDFGGQNSCFDKAVLLIKKQGYLGNMTFKMTLNDLKGQR